MAEIISISIDSETSREVEGLMKKEGYGSRSELVRAALRGFILERKQMEKLSGKVNAVLVLGYPCGKEGEIGRIKHEFCSIINFQTHSHAEGMCVESFSLSGDAKLVGELYRKLGKCRKAGYCKMMVL